MGERKLTTDPLLTKAYTSKTRTYRIWRNYFWVTINLFSNVRADAIVVRTFDEL